MREGQLGATGRVVVTDDERQKEKTSARFREMGRMGMGRAAGRTPQAVRVQISDFFFHSQNSDHQRLRLPSFLGVCLVP